MEKSEREDESAAHRGDDRHPRHPSGAGEDPAPAESSTHFAGRGARARNRMALPASRSALRV